MSIVPNQSIAGCAAWQANKGVTVKVRDWFWLVVVALLVIAWLIYVAPYTFPAFVHGF